MQKNYNHEQIEEVIQVLNDPKNRLLSFMTKYDDNKEMLDLYDELRNFKEAHLNLIQKDRPNLPLQWQKLNYKIGNSHKKKISWMIAASVILLISLTFVLQFETLFSPQQLVVDNSPIEKGEAKAILITSSGKVVELDENKDWVLKEKQGVKIVGDTKNLIHYNKDPISKDKSAKMAYNTLKIPRFAEYQIVLSDGTKVWLNSETELKYPIQFEGKQRVVELIGEAYFDVEKDASKPFFVKTKGIETRVLGTEFNVSAYPNEELNITLLEGKVQLAGKALSHKLILKPGENANRKRGATEMLVSEVDVKKITAWRDGYLYFEKERLEDILIKLQRWYDFKVFFQNPVVKDYEFRMRADKASDFNEIVNRLEATGRIQVDIKAKAVLISDVKR